jgi:hypothetical protein
LFKTLTAVLTACLAAVTLVLADSSTGPAEPAQSDLDAFMAQVLARRDENWKKLQQYILEERDAIDVHGPANLPIWGERTEYLWYIRDGYFVRSPVTANGVKIAEEERRRSEEEYLKNAKERDRRAKEREAAGGKVAGAKAEAAAAADAPKDIEGLIVQTRQPEFVNSAYFLQFKFEQGKYAFVGREQFDGLDVLRIEYYPARLFTDEPKDPDAEKQRKAAAAKDRGDDIDQAIQRAMNKVSLVTLWVEPNAHQIVKYTFDNVNFDFLPAAWLVRVNDARAAMTMSQPFPGVWLPRDVTMYFSAMLAIGSFDVRYRVDYHDYHEAKTSGRIIRAPEGASR